jgi:hypothetical protein
MCRFSGNLGASPSRNPKGLSRPVMGLLYLFFIKSGEKGNFISNIIVSIYGVLEALH